MIRYLKRSVFVIITFLALFIVFLRLRYGGGEEYKDISGLPLYGENKLSLFFSFNEPIGNVAVSRDSINPRVFFSVHPESRPRNNRLMEIVNGKAIPYPNAGDQQSLFKTVLGVYVDHQNRLWTIDHANHGFGDVKLLAFDLFTDEIVHEHVFSKKIGKRLSFFNDITVTPDGSTVFIADVNFFGKNPALVVYDINSGNSKRLLEKHQSIKDENYVPVTPAKKMRFFGGIADLIIGIDGLDISQDGKYVYYAGMGNSKLYRIPVASCKNFELSNSDLEKKVERIAEKPLSDGIRTDKNGNVYITDIENQGVYVVEPSGKGYTLIKSNKIRWADGFAIGNNGFVYLADSDIPNQMLRSKKNIAKNAPYHIYRFPIISH